MHEIKMNEKMEQIRANSQDEATIEPRVKQIDQ